MQNSEENTPEKKRKIFVLDTSVIIFDWECLSRLGENDVVVPITVIEELDNLKSSERPDVKFAARNFVKILDEHKVGEKFENATSFPSGVKVRIDSDPIQWTAKLKQKLDSKKNDNNIVLTALRLANEKDNNKEKREVILIAQDINMRVKAQALGLKAEFFSSGEARLEEGYTGLHTFDAQILFERASAQEIMEIVEKNLLDYVEKQKLVVNEVLIIPCDDDKFLYGILRQEGNNDKKIEWIDVEKHIKSAYCSPKNIGQAIAFHFLMNRDIQIVTITGRAGTGKTLISLIASWHELGDYYDKISVFRPYIEVGQSIGFLPGDLDEKMLPFKQPIFDNFKVLFENPYVNKKVRTLVGSKEDWKKMTEKEKEGVITKLEAESLVSIRPLSYTRGINLRKSFVIMDEAQNTTLHEIKTLVTRLGEGSKIVLLGDLDQIDNPYLTKCSNGLAHVIAKFKGNSLYAHIHLTKCERSSLSDIAAELL